MPHDAIYSIDRSGDSLWAIGGHGLILRSDNDGADWERIASPGDFAALGMAIHRGQPVIVGQAGKAFKLSTDGGNWVSLDSGTEERLLNIATLSNGSQLAVGSFGTIVERSDGSKRFKRVAVDWEAIVEDGFEPHLYDVMQTRAGTVLIAAEFGMILRSRNGGKTWSVQNTNDSSVFALHQAANGRLVGVGKLGTSSLQTMMALLGRLPNPVQRPIFWGVSSSGKTFGVVGVRAVLKSNNGGRSWQAISNRDTERRWYQGIAGISPDGDGRKFVAAGQFGQIVNF